jgi:signal transduction histidine kinase
MSVYTELLIGEGQTLSRSEQKSLLHRMKVNTNQMAVVVADLARFVRSAKPRWSVNQPVDIKETIEESVGAIGTLQHQKQLKLDLIIDDDLPQLHAPERVFHQLMTYLLTSACFYTGANGRVLITAHKDNLYESFENDAEGSATFLHVAIIGQPTRARQGNDNRFPGVTSTPPIEEIKEINQGEMRQELSLAKELVSNCNGRIWIDLESRTASQFSFLIPFADNVSVKAK